MKISKLLNIILTLLGCGCIFLVISAPLPGEVEGCSESSDESTEVDYIQYCINRCRVKTQKVIVECDIFEGRYTPDEFYSTCLARYNCSNFDKNYCQPRCEAENKDDCEENTFWKPFISVKEANDCLKALQKTKCEDWNSGEFPDLYECNIQQVCDSE